MSVGAATGAKAAPTFEADGYPATIEGWTIEAASVFSFSGYSFSCNEALHQGQLSGSEAALTLAAMYEECTWTWPPEPPKPSVVLVTMNGCDFRLHSLELEAKDEYLSLVNLECPTGKQVVIDMHSGFAVLCTLTVAAQSNAAHVRLINQTGKEGTSDDDVKAQITIEELHYAQDSPGFCPVKQGTYQNLQYLGISTLVATNQQGQQIGLRVSGE